LWSGWRIRDARHLCVFSLVLCWGDNNTLRLFRVMLMLYLLAIWTIWGHFARWVFLIRLFSSRTQSRWGVRSILLIMISHWSIMIRMISQMTINMISIIDHIILYILLLLLSYLSLLYLYYSYFRYKNIENLHKIYIYNYKK
jgi:hypothetical protein